MTSKIRHLVVLLVLLMTSGFVNAQSPSSYVHTRGTSLVDSSGNVLHLKGIGLGNWLVQEGYMFGFSDMAAAPHEIWQVVRELIGPAAARQFWDRFLHGYVTKSDIDFLKACGFNSVRVPFNYKLLTPMDEPGIYRGPGWAALDRVVHWCQEDGMYVILDMHCVPGGETGANIDDSEGYPFLYESPESQQRLVALWTQIAKRYRSSRAVLGYDLMNEPLPKGSYYDRYVPLLEPIYKRIAQAIRRVDPHHILILEGPNWDSNFEGFHAPFAANLVYEFHYYWSPVSLDGIRRFTAFRDRYQVPIWLGESGENTNTWDASFRTLLESQDIGWCFWPYKKIQSDRGVVTVKAPAGWDLITHFADSCRSASLLQRGHLRDSLPPARAQALLNAYLDATKLSNCQVNAGFLQALGLRVPAAFTGHQPADK